MRGPLLAQRDRDHLVAVLNQIEMVVGEGVDATGASRHKYAVEMGKGPEPDDLTRLQDALPMVIELPEPAVLAEHMIRRRRVDTLRPSMVQVSQYLNRLGIELDRQRQR
jgi:hypothetical protein